MDYFVHESSYVDSNVKIGSGTKIWHFSHLQSGCSIGKNCVIGQNVNISNNVKIGNFVKIQNNVSIYEGVEIEDYVFCGPSIVFTNVNKPRCEYPQSGSEFYLKTIIKKSASLGANCTIVCGHTIGEVCFRRSWCSNHQRHPKSCISHWKPRKNNRLGNKKGDRINFDSNGKSVCGKYLLNDNSIFLYEKIKIII